ncbi:MAG: glycosyltransferase [Lachnospiraceae bacterium]|jgi:Glycosyltransferases involved in cell wall biogenesis|nr:glycosyltransferase [Lachnospiraceae bacterium]
MGAEKQETVMVSICCITYNQEEYIRDALDGFLSQDTDFSYEVLIHDDASTDGTADIIREYARQYPEIIKPILQTENQYAKGLTNVSGTYNFPRAKGRYIAMCEGDDYWTDPHKLQRQTDYMEAHPDCSLVFHSACIEVQGRALTERRMRPYRRSRRVSPEEIIDKTSGYPTASLMFRADMVKILPDFYVNAPLADIPLQLMAAARGWAYYMDRPMCVYRLGGAFSWTTLMKQGDYERKQRQYYQDMKKMYRGFDRETGGRFHEVARRALARIYFLTKVNTKQYGEVLAKRNRRFYRELNLRTRFFIRFENAAPGLYELALKVFHFQEQ